jgi:hypothetical protein
MLDQLTQRLDLVDGVARAPADVAIVVLDGSLLVRISQPIEDVISQRVGHIGLSSSYETTPPRQVVDIGELGSTLLTPASVTPGQV